MRCLSSWYATIGRRPFKPRPFKTIEVELQKKKILCRSDPMGNKVLEIDLAFL